MASSSRTKSFFYNTMTVAFYQILVVIAGFITPRIMLIFYGSEINGLISSISQFIVYFNLVEAGLSGAAVYALYKPLSDQNAGAISGVVTAAKKFYIQAGYIFVSLTIGLAIMYPFLIETNSLTPISTGVLVLILGVNGALEFFTLAKYRVLLTADQKTYVVSLASMLHIIVNTLLIVILAYLGAGIVILRLVALCSIFLRSLILIIYVRRKYPFIDYKKEPDMLALNRRWDAFYLQILGVIQTGAPVVILTLILKDLKLVSIYSIFNMVIAGIGGILSIFISGLSASFGDVIVKGERKILQESYQIFEFAYYNLITFVYSVAFIMLMPFIRLYTEGITDTDYSLPLIGFLFVLNGLMYSIKTPQGMLVIAAGMYKETKLQTTIQGLIVVIGGIILTTFWGMAGVLASSILSNLYRDIDLMFFIPKNLTNLGAKKTGYRILRIFICIGIIWIPFLFININVRNYLDWCKISLAVGIYAVCVILISSHLFDKTDMRKAIIKILFIFRKKKHD